MKERHGGKICETLLSVPDCKTNDKTKFVTIPKIVKLTIFDCMLF